MHLYSCAFLYISNSNITARGVRAGIGLFAPPVAPGPAGAANSQPAANDRAADDFRCTQGVQRHIVCYCCMEMFPDRRLTPDTPPVAC